MAFDVLLMDPPLKVILRVPTVPDNAKFVRFENPCGTVVVTVNVDSGDTLSVVID
jgi:hypothetical protein